MQRDFLEDHELKALMRKNISVRRLAQVRDMFVFACWTGLSFSDLKGLKKEHLVRDNSGGIWIRKTRQKTKNIGNIPLLDSARQILEHYKDDPECVTKNILLPVSSNRKMNACLKELAAICGLNKEVMTHYLRHFFSVFKTIRRTTFSKVYCETLACRTQQ